jgi:hypothetical protein
MSKTSNVFFNGGRNMNSVSYIWIFSSTDYGDYWILNRNLKFKYQFLGLNKQFQSSNINFEIHYIDNLHTYAYYIYNFSTYIKIHPYVIVEYL